MDEKLAKALISSDGDKKVRKSVFDLQELTFDNPYPGNLPEELVPFHVDFARDGHCLMIIPQNYLEEALKEENELDDYEIQIPVRYVLEKGYKFVEGHPNYIVGFFDYDDEKGKVDVPTEYYED